MTVEHVEILVEEPSMEAALRILLPKILGEIPFEVFPHQCKADLLLRLPERLRGYGRRRLRDPWFHDHSRILVVVDRDADACEDLKQILETAARHAGLPTRTSSPGGGYAVVNRLAIEELEAWYFGDWDAVRAAYPKVPPTVPEQAKYRHPDEIAGGTWEGFERVLKKSGYFSGGLRKIEAARAVAANMDPRRNTSPSFRKLLEVLLEMT